MNLTFCHWLIRIGILLEHKIFVKIHQKKSMKLNYTYLEVCSLWVLIEMFHFFSLVCINLWLSKVPKLPSLLPRLMLLLLKVCLMTGMTLGGPQCHLQIQFEKTEEEFVHNVRTPLQHNCFVGHLVTYTCYIKKVFLSKYFLTLELERVNLEVFFRRKKNCSNKKVEILCQFP